MENVSAVTSFLLTAYAELEDHRYLYSSCFLLLYILIILSNSVLIVVISKQRDLHEPMYLFICNLAVNGLYTGTCIFPSLLKHLLSYNYKISLAHCVLQIYCIHSCIATEFTILAVMGFDRYVAICLPLHYHLLMSPKKLYVAITLTWVINFLAMLIWIMFTVQLTFCGRIIEGVYCSHFTLIKLSCFDTSIRSIAGLVFSLLTPGSPIIMIIYSYMEILRICFSASWESQKKALQTCSPHLLVVIIFSIGCVFELFQSRVDMSDAPGKARIFMSLYILIIPPLFNPVIYGISNQAIRVHVFKLLCGNTR